MVNKYITLTPLHLSPMEAGSELLLFLNGLRLLNNSVASLLAVIGCLAFNYLKELSIPSEALLLAPVTLSSCELYVYLCIKVGWER